MGAGVTPDQQRCVTWVGGVLLEELSSCKGGVTDSKFLHEWQNLLPEGWRKSAAFNALKVFHLHKNLIYSSNRVLHVVRVSSPLQ